ncbi:MAG: YkgJ family cysteine cluster protein [Hyphomicrobiales bacterium]|nr:MAG: YkgJ family cysteine cluster protein [Hyphomicrobiales bacterium]
MDDENSQRYARAQLRQTAFMQALPKALRDEEDAIPAVIRTLNASTRSKLQRIYRLADALGESRAPFVACKKGCAGCCHMNITISSEEASRISAASGRIAKRLTHSIRRDVDAFAGVPCPFLDAAGACSVYPDRPLVCRNHTSFDET